MALTDTQIKKVKPTDKLQKLSDGEGLQLHVAPTGGKLWRWAYRSGGKQKTMGLGTCRIPCDHIPVRSWPLFRARELHSEGRKLLAAGTDPMQQRKAAKVAAVVATENNFEAVAREWWTHWKTARSDSHTGYVIRRLEADVFPVIGTHPISEIEAPDLVRIVKGVAQRGALDIAKRCLQMCGQIFRYAIAHGKATRNPATDIKPGDILPARTKENYARIDAKELPALLRKIEGYQGLPHDAAGAQIDGADVR